jgi:hypothetical protein
MPRAGARWKPGRWAAKEPSSDRERCDLNAFAVEAFNDLLKKHGKRQLVENPLLDRGWPELRAFGLIGFSCAGHFLMACSPKRMLLAPVLVGIALGRNVFSRGALALFIRIWISSHNLFVPAELTLRNRNGWSPNRQRAFRWKTRA